MSWCVLDVDGLRVKLSQNPELDDFTEYVTPVYMSVHLSLLHVICIV